MEIKQAEFISSHANINKCPLPDKPEVAFIGRSNVGKSSLINMLTNRNKLAKVSVSPGKTQTINHYLINSTWYLVDLPGYGYAKVNKSLRYEWGKMIEEYLLKRENLDCLFILVDSRLEPQKIDIGFINWVGQKGIPCCIVYTKLDKLNKTQFLKNKKLMEQELLQSWEQLPPMMETSSTKKTGRDELIAYIGSIVNLHKTNPD
jgi:GTP-binding protein